MAGPAGTCARRRLWMTVCASLHYSCGRACVRLVAVSGRRAAALIPLVRGVWRAQHIYRHPHCTACGGDISNDAVARGQLGTLMVVACIIVQEV